MYVLQTGNIHTYIHLLCNAAEGTVNENNRANMQAKTFPLPVVINHRS